MLHYRGKTPPFLSAPISQSDLISPQGTPYQVHVSAAKAAVDSISAVLAVEEGPHGVRSNVIAPGPVSGTAGMDRLKPNDSPSESMNDKLSGMLPLGRVGHVKDVANATVFLFSDAAAFITGQIIAIDGGHEHLRTSYLPYPQSVFDPTSVKHLINKL
jgi:peroxisomal 2,4-dienoyl-CoA reductase